MVETTNNDLALQAHAAARSCNDLADRLEVVTGHVIRRLRHAATESEDRIGTAHSGHGIVVHVFEATKPAPE